MNVLIVQLFPRQFEWLNKVYGGPHQLDFLDSAKDESIDRLKTKVRQADKVVVLTKFVSHSHTDVIPKDKTIYADSVNMDRLLHILDTLPDSNRPASEVKKSAEPKVHTVIKPKTIEVPKAPMSTSTTREVGGFVLTTAVPAPGAKEKSPPWPFAEMKVGESFFVECSDKERPKLASRIAANYAYFRKKHPKHNFRTAVQDGGVRCWRIQDKSKQQ